MYNIIIYVFNIKKICIKYILYSIYLIYLIFDVDTRSLI